jgi:capsular polysaccharide biosynthesis protein
MELRHYWGVILHRAWVVVALVAIVLVTYLPFQRPSPPVYTAGMRFVVGVEPEQAGDYYAYDRYYTWLTAEYLVDDLSEVVKSQAFSADVAALAGLPVSPGAISGATSSGKLHRVLSVSITWGNDRELAAIANAVVQILTTDASRYFGQLGTGAAVVSLIDAPAIAPVGASLRQRLDLPLRLLLALAAGIGLTFLLDYVDDSVRHRNDLARLGPPVLGQVPAPAGWRRFWPKRHAAR